jgi:hydroxymethylbilane synthase
MSRAIRIGTRGSALALRQAGLVRQRLDQHGPTELVEIRTAGDRQPDVSISGLEGSAFFTQELDDALLDGRIDVAVHSLKDVPTLLPVGVVIAAVSAREDARDALVGREPLRWIDLGRGATVATSSVRRRAQMLRARPDLDVVDIRGNVDTRLRKLDTNRAWTATVLAAAGLRRLGLAHRIGECLPDDVMMPAPGQGALAVTAREDDARMGELLARAVHDADTAVCVTAERTLLRALEGGCQAPIGALAQWTAGADRTLRLAARLVSPDGATGVEGRMETPNADGDAARDLGLALAERLRGEGGAAILAALRPAREERRR